MQIDPYDEQASGSSGRSTLLSPDYFESDEDRLDRSFLHPRKDVHNAKELVLFEYRSAENPP